MKTLKLLIIIGVLGYALGASRAHSAELPASEFVFDAALALDMLTTANIHKHYGMYETNPVMGRHPTDWQIAAYGASSALVHAGVTLAMEHLGASPRAVAIWEYASIGFELGYVAHNYHIGLRAKF